MTKIKLYDGRGDGYAIAIPDPRFDHLRVVGSYLQILRPAGWEDWGHVTPGENPGEFIVV
jgi:hypothetical protein